jgi:hypothetical protein
MLPQVLPKASTTSDKFGDGVCRISGKMAGVCSTRKIKIHYCTWLPSCAKRRKDRSLFTDNSI